MRRHEESQEKVSGMFRSVDLAAYIGAGVYSLIHIAWFIWMYWAPGFLIFDTAGLIGLFAPFLGILALVVFQCCSENKFSMLATLVAILVIVGWFLAVWALVSAASAAV